MLSYRLADLTVLHHVRKAAVIGRQVLDLRQVSAVWLVTTRDADRQGHRRCRLDSGCDGEGARHTKEQTHDGDQAKPDNDPRESDR